MTIRKRIIGVSVLMTALIIGVMLVAGRNGTERMRIGIITALTGTASDYGLPVLHGALVARDEINVSGGINGSKLDFIVEDGKCSPKDSVNAVQKLIERDQVAVLLTGCSSETLAVAPIAEQKRIMVIGMVSTSPKVSDAGSYVFRTSPSDLLGLQKFAEATYAQLNYRTIAILSEQRDYPQGLKEGFQKVYEALGGNVTASETFIEKDHDLKTTLAKLSQSGADALIVFVQSSPTGAQLLKQIRESGIKLPILGNEVFSGDAVVKTVPQAAEGVVFMTPKLDTERTRTKKLLDSYRTKYPDENPPNILYVATAYDAVYLAKEAIEHCQTNAECMKEYLYSLKNWEGAAGALTFDQSGDPMYEYVIKTIRNREVVDLEQ